MIRPRLRAIMPRATALDDKEHAVEIGAHEFAPGVLGIVFERRAALDAGVVDEDVDRPDLGLDRVEPRPRSEPARSRRTPQRWASAPSARKRVDRRVDGRSRSAVDDDARPGAGEAASEREADAGGRAGDQGDGPGEAEQTIDEAVHGTLPRCTPPSMLSITWLASRDNFCAPPLATPYVIDNIAPAVRRPFVTKRKGRGMSKPTVLMIGAYPEWDMPSLERAYDLRKFWLAADKEAFLAEAAPDARAIATRGRTRRVRRADRSLPEARDHLLLRRRRRRDRSRAGARAGRARHQHARRSDRRRRGFRLRADPRAHAQGDRGRRACPVRRVARGNPAARREPAGQDARHPRLRAHRPRDRAARRRVRRDDRLFRRRAGGRRVLRPLPVRGSNWPRRATSSSRPCPAARRRAASSTPPSSRRSVRTASSSTSRAARWSTRRR